MMNKAIEDVCEAIHLCKMFTIEVIILILNRGVLIRKTCTN